MKKVVFLLCLILITHIAFSQTSELPFIMIEAETGYAVGISLDNAAFFDARFFTAFNRFGFVLQAGMFFNKETLNYHIFLGPVFYILNTSKWRLPLAVGLDVFGDKASYLGIGGLISLQYAFTKRFYAGLNLGITYAFNYIYEEVTGYRTDRIIVDDGSGNAVFTDRTVPIYENKNHYGSYFYFKPSLAVGLQF